jgi:hypothetical protein
LEAWKTVNVLIARIEYSATIHRRSKQFEQLKIYRKRFQKQAEKNLCAINFISRAGAPLCRKTKALNKKPFEVGKE